MAREQDFAPGVGDIEIYANTDRQGVWLAWQDNAPVSCIAAVTYNPDCAFIGLFVVKPEHRGKGIGRRLWQHALKTLSGVQCIGLEAAVCPTVKLPKISSSPKRPHALTQSDCCGPLK